MSHLLITHSYLRFLVLFSTLAFAVIVLSGVLQRRLPGRVDRIAGGIFCGFIDMQLVLGLVMVLSGHLTRALHAHVGTMLLLVVIAHFASVMNRRRTPGHSTPAVVFTLLAVALVGTGILVLGRGGLFGGIAIGAHS